MKKQNPGKSYLFLALILILAAALIFLFFLSKKEKPEESSQSEESSSSIEESSHLGEVSPQESQVISPPEESKAPATDYNQWSLILVNQDSPHEGNFDIELEIIPSKHTNKESYFDKRALPALMEMIEAAAADGVTLVVTSAYRSFDRQTVLYNNKVQEYKNKGHSQADAEVAASRFVAIPGTSEHATGLAVDIISADWYSYNKDLYDTFDQTQEFAWLSENAASFGFILRFPSDKEAITKIAYEPWHYRYVGEYALEITENGLCLEEFHARKDDDK